MSVTPFRQKRVGVFPRLRFQSESRLLSSLASLYPVNFSPEGEIGFDRMDAAVFFPRRENGREPRFCARFKLIFLSPLVPEPALHAHASVNFSDHNILPATFRNRRIALGSRRRHVAGGVGSHGQPINWLSRQ